MTTVRRPAALGTSLILFLALTSLAIGACSTAAGGAEDRVATTTVDLPRSYRFAPADITVAPGATVIWTNHDNFTHSVAFEGSEPMRLAPGEQVSSRFTTPGLYAYVCSLHPTDMRGSVLVTEP